MKMYALTVCFLSFFVSTGTWSQETPEVAPLANTTNDETPEPAQPAAKAQNERAENQTEEKEIEKPKQALIPRRTQRHWDFHPKKSCSAGKSR